MCSRHMLTCIAYTAFNIIIDGWQLLCAHLFFSLFQVWCISRFHFHFFSLLYAIRLELKSLFWFVYYYNFTGSCIRKEREKEKCGRRVNRPHKHFSWPISAWHPTRCACILLTNSDYIYHIIVIMCVRACVCLFAVDAFFDSILIRLWSFFQHQLSECIDRLATIEHLHDAFQLKIIDGTKKNSTYFGIS